MVSPYNTAIIFTILTAFCWSSSAYSRQNIIIGEISTGYDFTERKYDDNDANLSEVERLEEVVSPDDNDEGDTRRWLVTPRIRVYSQGINDLLEFTYAPSLYYDELESDTDIGHDLNLQAEKYFTRNWRFFVSDSYYYGDDAVEDAALRSAAIIPGIDESEGEQTVGAEQAGETGQSLREQNERREYWRNNFNIGTDYTYAQDSVVGLDYTFAVLRNNSDDDDGYDDYDQHEATGRLSYRFNRSWQIETQVGYVKGIYESTEITLIQPEISQVAVEAELSDDLEEYQFLSRLNYDWRTRDRFFGLYSYNATEYESALREDTAIHEITLGWSHDFSRALRMTLSGGPSFATYDERSTDTGYNAYGGVIWDVHQHASLSANSSYGYEFDNFDGDRTGLRQIWRSELGYSYQFSPQLDLSLSTGYEKSDNEEPLAPIAFLDSEGEDILEYTEEQYDAGLTLSYNFLRWYTVSASYRYADYQSENDRDYDEHRVFLTLSVSKEMFRW